MSELKMLLFAMAVGPFFLHDRIHTLILLSILHYSTNTNFTAIYIFLYYLCLGCEYDVFSHIPSFSNGLLVSLRVLTQIQTQTQMTRRAISQPCESY